MNELLFEYKVMCNGKEIKLYSTTDIEEFLVRNNIKYVRNVTDTLEHRLLREIERLTELCNKYEEEHKTTFETWQKDIKENELLHSIIKEVRELREQLSYQYYENGFEYDTPMLLKDLDKILDKVGEE